MNGAWFTSNNSKFIGLLERDEFALDPRKDPELVPEMAEQYDDGDVWCYTVYPIAFKPHMQVAIGGCYGNAFPIENLIGNSVASLGGIYGWDYARELILNALEECENAEERNGGNSGTVACSWDECDG